MEGVVPRPYVSPKWFLEAKNPDGIRAISPVQRALTALPHPPPLPWVGAYGHGTAAL